MGEESRELMDVIIIDESAKPKELDWHKTNLVTVIGRSGIYDEMKCSVCGITGKRHGLGDVTRDNKYKAKVYGDCPGTFRKIEKQKDIKQTFNGWY